MAVRGEIFSVQVPLEKRTYFFNVKENRLGDLYLNIVESRKEEDGKFDRKSIVVFDENKEQFLRGLGDALKMLDKESVRRKPSARPAPSNKKPYRKNKPSQ